MHPGTLASVRYLTSKDWNMQPSQRPARLKVGIIGTGRVGSVLGAALTTAGHHVVACSGVSKDSVRRAERHLPGVPRLDVPDVVDAAELVVVAVPDDVLEALVQGLADTERWRIGQLVVHTSGAYGIGVLGPAIRMGVVPLALHPAMTFAGQPEDFDRLVDAPFGVTAPEELRPVAEALVLEMGGNPIWVPEEARALYHAALAAGANHLVTLVAESQDLLARAGVDGPSHVLRPLLEAALDNALRAGDAATTGPVVRGDARTVARHIETLRRYAPGAVASYVALARLTADRALASGRLTPDGAEALLDVLATRPHGSNA